MSTNLAEPRTSVILNERKRITSRFTDGSEMIEEYDIITDDLLLRKYRTKNALGNHSNWEIEVGSEAKTRNLDKEVLMEVSGSPELVKQDTPEYHVFRIRNLPYPKEVFSVAVERPNPDCIGEIVIRTSNKKYFKRLNIPVLQRYHIPLDPAHLHYDVQHNTLIIRYKKHLSVLAAEAAAKRERTVLPAKRVGTDDNGCSQQ